MDAVLLTKHRISDKQLMQRPLLMLPAEIAQRLDWNAVPDSDSNNLLPQAAGTSLRTAKGGQRASVGAYKCGPLPQALGTSKC